MDHKSAIEAVEAIRSTVDPDELASFDAELADRLGLVADTAGPAATGATVEVQAVENAETSSDSVKEAITGQLTSSYAVYDKLTAELNKGRRKNKVDIANEETVAAALDGWLTEDKLDYVKSAQEADPDLRFTLVVTANTPVSAKEVIRLGKQFGEDQPYPTSVYSPIFEAYTSKELSGVTDDGEDINFVLIPSKFTEDMYGTVEQQRGKLARMQDSDSFLRVPSVVEDVAYWETLRAQDDSLRGDGVFDRTYTRHFDLPEKRVGGYFFVPDSYVFDRGEPYLRDSDARVDHGGRVAVG